MQKWILHAATSTKKEAKRGEESCLAWGLWTFWGCLAGGSGGVGWGDGGRSRLWEEEEKVVEERKRLEGEEGESQCGRLVVVLASYGGVGVLGSNGGGRRPQWREREEEMSCRGEKEFTVAYYRGSGGWPMVLATLGGSGCSRRSWRKKWWQRGFPVAEEERRRNRKRESAVGRGRMVGFLDYFGPDFLLP